MTKPRTLDIFEVKRVGFAAKSKGVEAVVIECESFAGNMHHVRIPIDEFAKVAQMVLKVAQLP